MDFSKLETAQDRSSTVPQVACPAFQYRSVSGIFSMAVITWPKTLPRAEQNDIVNQLASIVKSKWLSVSGCDGRGQIEWH